MTTDNRLPDIVTSVTDTLVGWAAGLIELLPNIAIAGLVMLLAVPLAGVLGRLAARAAGRFSRQVQIASLVEAMTRALVVGGALFLALSVLGLDKAVTSLIAGVGVVGIALGFAFQDIAANFMSGLLLAAKRPFEVGDWVELSGYEGTVQAVDLRSVTIQRFTGELVELPNKDVFQKPMVNHVRSGVRRIDVPVGVAYDSDLEHAMRIGLDAVGSEHALPERTPDVHVRGFGDSSIDLVFRFWIPTDDAKGGLARKTDAIVALKQAFDRAGISIPFPTRTLEGPLLLQPAYEQRAAK